MVEVIPTLHIVADNIPQAHYRATKAVFENGMEIRTQYDRKDKAENYIDPPSKDAKVLIEVKNPFNQPRYPIASYCEIGEYIAEILGAKNHFVISFDRLRKELNSGKLKATEWPYHYNQRLFSYPLQNGRTINQIDTALEKLVKDPISRRAVASTSVPETDCSMEEDIPCLREVQLRCTEKDSAIYLHMDTKWRSRDLFKAWSDNVIGLTFLQQELAFRLSEKMNREVKIGSYSDYSSSLHLYGQDINEKGVAKYVELGEEKALNRAMGSEKAKERLVLPQLEDFLAKAENYPEERKEIIRKIISDLKEGKRTS